MLAAKTLFSEVPSAYWMGALLRLILVSARHAKPDLSWSRESAKFQIASRTQEEDATSVPKASESTMESVSSPPSTVLILLETSAVNVLHSFI